MSDLLARLRDADTTRRIGESYADTHERRHRDREEAADRIAQLEAREKELTLEGLALIGRIEMTRDALAGTDAGSLPNDYPLERLAADRMARIAQLEAALDVVRASGLLIGLTTLHDRVRAVVHAAIDLIRAETLEEAARVADEKEDEWAVQWRAGLKINGHLEGKGDGACEIAAAIRALREAT